MARTLRSKSSRSAKRSTTRKAARKTARKYPKCFDICGASRAIYDLAKKLKALRNPNVIALVRHHSAILCAEKALRRNSKACTRVRRRLAKFVKLPAKATLNRILNKFHSNMAGVAKKLAPALNKAQKAAFVKNQTMFESLHFAFLLRAC